MKLNDLISSLQELEKVVGNVDTVIYAYGGDHGGFLYPGDAILGESLIIKDSDINSFMLPDYDRENSGVDKDTKDLAVLRFKYSIEVDEIKNGHEDFDLDFISSDLANLEYEEDEKEKEKMKEKLKWLDKTKIFDFDTNKLVDTKKYLEENLD